MKTRIITGVIAAAIFVPLLFLAPANVLAWIFAAISFLGIWELSGCCGFRKQLQYLLPMAIASPAVIVLSFYGKNADAYPILACVTLFLFAVAVIGGEKAEIGDVSVFILFSIYVTLGFLSIVSIRKLHVDDGAWLFLLPFVSAWVTDTFAYFTGYFFGKHKLCPTVSPKKTVEGALGGIFFCGGLTLVFGVIVAACTDTSPRYFSFLAIGLVLSVVSQIGDLILSMVKRRYGVKDYGKLLPGHGGILDRFDSVIATAIVLNIACNLISFFK